MLNVLRKSFRLINILRVFGYKKFTQELKLWGPKFYRNYIHEKYCKGFLEVDSDLIEDIDLRKSYDNFKSQDYVKIPCGKEIVSKIHNLEVVSKQKDKDDRVKSDIAGFDNKFLEKHISSHAYQLLKLIIGRDFWIRDDAFIMHHGSDVGKKHFQSEWHVDGYNQITMQILLEDSKQDPTCTEIMLGSSSKNWDFNRSNIDNHQDFDVKGLYGKAGDIFIFFGGGALHRAKIGAGGRKALFINFSTGWYESGIF